jgi:hypothetical protein
LSDHHDSTEGGARQTAANSSGLRQLQTEETESELKKDFDRICFESLSSCIEPLILVSNFFAYPYLVPRALTRHHMIWFLSFWHSQRPWLFQWPLSCCFEMLEFVGPSASKEFKFRHDWTIIKGEASQAFNDEASISKYSILHNT